MALFRQSVAHPRKPWPVALAVVFVLGTILTAFAVVGGGPLGHAAQSAYGAPSGGGTALAASAAVRPIRATLSPSKTMPARSAAERQAEQARTQALHSQLKAAPVGPHPNANQVTGPRSTDHPLVAPRPSSATTPKPGQAQAGNPQACPADDACFVNENQSYILSAGVCPTDCGTSSVAEPSVGNDGKHIMLSFNWGDAVSHDNATTWGFIDPYTTLGALGIPFCCDQQVLYEPSRDRMWWEALGFGGFGAASNGILLWSSAGTNLSSFCGYYIQGPAIGQASGTLLDYPQIEFSANFVYLTINSYDSGGSWFSSTVMRMPLTAWSTCTSGAFQYITRNDNFSYALAQGATDTMYWDSNWYTTMGGTGTTARIFFLGENSNSYTFYDKSLGFTWNFFNEGSVSCASSDAAITNWCTRLDPRRGTLFRSRAGFKGFGAPMLGMAWTSGPAGCTIGGGNAYPYVTVEYFLLSTLTWKQGEYFHSCNNFAVAYPSMAAPTQRGYIGGDFSWGGGLSGVNYFPGNFYSIQDPDAANAPGSVAYWFGFDNATAWGDYNTVRPWNPDGLHWMGAGWVMSAGVSFPFIYIYGRGRDHNAYLRWSTT